MSQSRRTSQLTAGENTGIKDAGRRRGGLRFVLATTLRHFHPTQIIHRRRERAGDDNDAHCSMAHLQRKLWRQPVDSRFRSGFRQLLCSTLLRSDSSPLRTRFNIQPILRRPRSATTTSGSSYIFKKNMTDQKEKIQFQNFFKYTLYYRHSDSLGK